MVLGEDWRSFLKLVRPCFLIAQTRTRDSFRPRAAMAVSRFQRPCRTIQAMSVISPMQNATESIKLISSDCKRPRVFKVDALIDWCSLVDSSTADSGLANGFNVGDRVAMTVTTRGFADDASLRHLSRARTAVISKSRGIVDRTEAVEFRRFYVFRNATTTAAARLSHSTARAFDDTPAAEVRVPSF